MSKKLFVGNLPFSVDSDKLKKLFSSFGEIEEATMISDKFSGRSKGFGFVTFKSDESADNAISEMNDKEVEGRGIKVSEAKPMDPDRPRPARQSFGSSRPRGNFGGSRDRDRPRRF